MGKLQITGLIILSLILIAVLTMALGGFGVFYKNTIGVADESANRNVFKQNKAYVEGMVRDLAKYKLELTMEKDITARRALSEFINEKRYTSSCKHNNWHTYEQTD